MINLPIFHLRHRWNARTIIFLVTFLFIFFFGYNTGNASDKNTNKKENSFAASGNSQKKEEGTGSIHAGSLSEAGIILAKDIASKLDSVTKSVAVLPPINTEMEHHTLFERRIAEIITNSIKPHLPKGCRLSERFNLKQIFEDGTIYGKENVIDDLLENAGVDINITGSYSLLKKSDQIEIYYRAVRVKDGESVAVSKPIYIPISELYEGEVDIIIFAMPMRNLSTASNQEMTSRATLFFKETVSGKGLAIVDTNTQIQSFDDLLSYAQEKGVEWFLFLEVDESVSSSDYGITIGKASLYAKLYRPKDKNIIFSMNDTMEVGSLSDKDKPSTQALDVILDSTAEKIIDAIAAGHNKPTP